MECGLLFIFFQLLSKTSDSKKRFSSGLNIQINEQILVTVFFATCFFWFF